MVLICFQIPESGNLSGGDRYLIGGWIESRCRFGIN